MKTLLALSALALLLIVGCASRPAGSPSTIDRWLFKAKMGEVAVVTAKTNVVTITNIVPIVVEKETIRYITNTLGTVNITTNINVTTNHFASISVYTNYQVITNAVSGELVDYGEAHDRVKAGSETIGAVVNLFWPGLGGLITGLIGSGIAIYSKVREKKLGEAFVKGAQTARAVVDELSQNPAVSEGLKEKMIEHQKELNVFKAISKMVEEFQDKPEAREEAKEILSDAKAADVVP